MSDPDFLTGRPLRSGYDVDTAPASLRWLYEALAPAPTTQYGGTQYGGTQYGGTRYGDLLPVAKRPDGSIGFPTMPNVVRQGLLGMADLLSGTKTGELTGRGAAAITTGGLGAGGMLAPRGAFAAGAARLPMDRASQLTRARAMGFNPDLPLYRGVPKGADLGSFQAVAPWEAVRVGRPPGVSVAEDPLVASRFSDPRVRDLLGLSTHNSISHPEGRALPGPISPDVAGSRVYPLVARVENPFTYRLPDRPNWRDVWHDAAGLMWDGHDAVRLTNYRMFPDLGPQANWLIRSPNQLRSPFARFDPARRESDDLLAGFAVPAPAVPGFNVTPSAEPGFRVPVKAGRSAAEMEF